MPANKSQHYVPRCYLRAFCSDSEGASINVFNFARELSIEAAPAKSQCAKPYFYGRNRERERALQAPEGQYSEVMARAVVDPHALTDSDMFVLHAFMLLQSYRSAAWIEGQMILAEHQRELLARENATQQLLEGLKVSHEMALDLAFGAFEESVDATAHMERRILLNGTDRPLFTSDDPVVYTNRFHVQKGGLGRAGLSSPGGMLLMPLTPQMILLSFDPGVYRLERRVEQLGLINRREDVAAINQLQVIRGRSNLYFRDWHDRQMVAASFNDGKDRRREQWFTVETLQEVEANTGTFVVARDGWEHDPARREILHTARILPVPQRWPDILTYTLRARRAGRGIDHSRMYEAADQRAP